MLIVVFLAHNNVAHYDASNVGRKTTYLGMRKMECGMKRPENDRAATDRTMVCGAG